MAPPAPLVALKDARLAFAPAPLFAGLSLGLARGDRLCLVGRNGSGKSTLLAVLAGETELDAGERFLRPGTRVVRLAQDPAPPGGGTLLDYAARDLPPDEAERLRARATALLRQYGLDPERSGEALSGGERRRAALVRALAREPDVLLLDEPTNHLDLPTIERLESELARFDGALLVISHDRAFLSRVSNGVLWLDRGRVHRLDAGFERFDAWADTLHEQEGQARHRLEREIHREQRWLARGVTARRKRNQGRLARLAALRAERARWLRPTGAAKLAVELGPRSGETVIEAEHLGKSVPQPGGGRRLLVRDFSTRIRRGERIGLIGPNGAGKTTLVRLLIGDLTPDDGTVRLGSNVTPLYFDQARESLDPDATLWRSLVPDGGDAVVVGGRQRHVVSYLRDFLFDEAQARQPVRSLSGGEKNRLLLARLFTKPGNLLVLDEPTNDLDMETLDLLTELLDDYAGTALIVSHDRDFLDRLATGILALVGDGVVRDYAGGYSDYLAQRGDAAPAAPDKQAPDKPAPARPATRPTRGPTKLSYKEQRELEALPAQIAQLEAALDGLERRLSDPAFYGRDPQGFATATRELETARDRLARAEDRWLELEAKRERLAERGPAAR
jgi:ATP-binding cassette subfamily F protein uup